MKHPGGLEGVLAIQGKPRFRFRVTSKDRAGNIIGISHMSNMVVGAGLNKILDAVFKTGIAAPAWYIGLKGAGTVVIGDTMASHAGWAELGAAVYSESTRPAFTPGDIASYALDNSASLALFNTIAATSVYGLFLCDDSEVDGDGGTLYCAGDLSIPVAVTNGGTFEAVAMVSF